MELYEVISRRRSVRRFKRNPVTEETVLKVLEAGRWAPSACNGQPWHFVVVTDVAVKRKIAEVCTEFSKKAWKQFSPQRAKYLAARGGSWNKSKMENVPVLVVVCYEVLKDVREELASASAWLAVENMLLSATAEDLGSCIYTTFNNEEEAKLKGILKVPSDYRIATIIQLGYADGVVPVPQRKRLSEIVSHQHF